MPLRYQGILERLDPAAQAAVSTAYLELCQIIEAQTFPPEKDAALRDDIARFLLMLAQDGETDSETLKARAATYLPAR